MHYQNRVKLFNVSTVKKKIDPISGRGCGGEGRGGGEKRIMKSSQAVHVQHTKTLECMQQENGCRAVFAGEYRLTIPHETGPQTTTNNSFVSDLSNS